MDSLYWSSFIDYLHAEMDSMRAFTFSILQHSPRLFDYSILIISFSVTLTYYTRPISGKCNQITFASLDTNLKNGKIICRINWFKIKKNALSRSRLTKIDTKKEKCTRPHFLIIISIYDLLPFLRESMNNQRKRIRALT